jgi:hypothetical protein
MPPALRMMPVICWPMRLSSTGCHGTSWKPMPLSIMAKRPLASWVEQHLGDCLREFGDNFSRRLWRNSHGEPVREIEPRKRLRDCGNAWELPHAPFAADCERLRPCKCRRHLADRSAGRPRGQRVKPGNTKIPNVDPSSQLGLHTLFKILN